MNCVYNENCLHTMDFMPDNYIDLVVTSPPYDDIRIYNGYVFDFESVAKELYRVIKKGGVMVWVVSDKTFKGSESGTSFRQALYFKEVGFNLHDTMIWNKVHTFGTAGNPPRRYAQNFEYMFVLSKGTPSAINLIRVDCLRGSKPFKGTTRRKRVDSRNNQRLHKLEGVVQDTKIDSNIKEYIVGYNSQTDPTAFEHPAIFPEALVEDHIISWSNEGDLVYDPFAGSGTTLVAAKKLNRNFIGSEISSEYCDLINRRLVL